MSGKASSTNRSKGLLLLSLGLTHANWSILELEVSASAGSAGHFDLRGLEPCSSGLAPRPETNVRLSAALLPDVNGNFRTSADFGALKHVSAAQTMVGDPKSRAQAGRFGMLWLTALTFSVMKEAQAADPNVTFLDDDNITYKDLEHGAFELVTKEAVPRHIIVEDPGETIVLSKTRILSQRKPECEYPLLEWRSCRRPNRTCSPTSRKGWGRPGRAHLPSSIRCRCNESILFRPTAPQRQNSLPPPGVDQRRSSRDHFRQGAASEPPTLNATDAGRPKSTRWCLTPSPRRAELSLPAVRAAAPR